MASGSSLVFAGIAPHPPIMVPEVGREAIADVRRSIDAMAALTARVIQSEAETVVLISPHAPLEPDAFVAYAGPDLHADFANFRAPTATVHAQLDEELLKEITRAAAESEFEVVRIRGDLDHGTAVPLYFLQRHGWHGRVIALGYSFLSNEDHLRFGNCIRAAIDKVGRRVAFIASGDLSHRLKPDAPAGYNPQAHLFDEEVVEAIRTNSTRRIVSIDQELRRTAGECGYRSMLVAIGVAQELESRCEVISYEAPFGVGYMVAQLMRSAGILPAQRAERAQSESVPPASAGRGTEPLAVASGYVSEPRPVGVAGGPNLQADTRDVTGTGLPALARQTIETFVKERRRIPEPKNLSELLNQRAGCFVSIKTIDGDLRGCIGTIEPEKNTLAEELIANAISAASRDPRFPPVRANELPNLKYSVDVLSQPELVRLEDLDPLVYGVIVEDQDGRRGLLLPNLEGIDTAAKQVEIASRKAGIAPGTEVKLRRFRAERYREET